MAERLEMTPQTYQHLVNKKQLSFADIKRIADAVGLDMKIEFIPKTTENLAV